MGSLTCIARSPFGPRIFIAKQLNYNCLAIFYSSLLSKISRFVPVFSERSRDRRGYVKKKGFLEGSLSALLALTGKKDKGRGQKEVEEIKKIVVNCELLIHN